MSPYHRQSEAHDVWGRFVHFDVATGVDQIASDALHFSSNPNGMKVSGVKVGTYILKAGAQTMKVVI